MRIIAAGETYNLVGLLFHIQLIKRLVCGAISANIYNYYWVVIDNSLVKAKTSLLLFSRLTLRRKFPLFLSLALWKFD